MISGRVSLTYSAVPEPCRARVLPVAGLDTLNECSGQPASDPIPTPACAMPRPRDFSELPLASEVPLSAALFALDAEAGRAVVDDAGKLAAELGRMLPPT